MGSIKLFLLLGMVTATLVMPKFECEVRDKKSIGAKRIISSARVKALKADLNPTGRGTLTVTGELVFGQEKPKRVEVYVAVVHPQAGTVETVKAEVTATRTGARFAKKLGGPFSGRFNYSLGGYKVITVLFINGKQVSSKTAHIEKQDPEIGRNPADKKHPPDSSIAFDTGQPTTGKSGTTPTYWIRGFGTYDPGKTNAGTACGVSSIVFKAKNITTLTLYSSTAVFAQGVWTGQVPGDETAIVPGDYDVWAELTVTGTSCTSSATNTARITVTK